MGVTALAIELGTEAEPIGPTAENGRFCCTKRIVGTYEAEVPHYRSTFLPIIGEVLPMPYQLRDFLF